MEFFFQWIHKRRLHRQLIGSGLFVLRLGKQIARERNESFHTTLGSHPFPLETPIKFPALDFKPSESSKHLFVVAVTVLEGL